MGSSLPVEPGQGAFAAIAEIVTLLQADAGTDWDRVDIAALRAHLIDMDDLINHAQVSVENIPQGAIFRIATKGPGGGAVQRMVPAHAPVLAGETGWSSSAEVGEDQIVWTVTAQNETTEAATEIRALGFFGLMAVGGHHQAHHLAMASGHMVH